MAESLAGELGRYRAGVAEYRRLVVESASDLQIER
jgi:hypothetical protein